MAGKEDLKLLGSPVSPFAVRAHMALTMKGVRYELIEQDLFKKSRLLLSSNPARRKVPVLIHNGKPICESLVIMEYLDETFEGPPILPGISYDRAVVRFWAAYIDNEIYPLLLGIIKATREDNRRQKVKQSAEMMKHLEDAFAKCSNGNAFFGGNSVGYLDLALGSLLFWFKTLHKVFHVEIIDPCSTPLLASWAKRFMETSYAKEVAPEEAKLVEHLKKAYKIAASARAAL